jgi:hypothetical protein
MQSSSNEIENSLKEPRWKNIVLVLAAAVLVLALLSFVITGTYIRYIADDYCSASSLRGNGFWQAQWLSYSGWSNRFSTMLVTGLIDPLDVTGIRILPGVLVAGLLASAYFALYRLNEYFGLKASRLVLAALSGVLIFFSLYTIPNRFQSLYWRSGSITYSLPIIGVLLLLAMLFKRRAAPAPWWQLALIGLFCFFLMGFSETNAVLSAAVVGIGLAVILIRQALTKRKSVSLGVWLAAMIGCVVGLIAVMLAPGNAVRMALMPERLDTLSILTFSLRYGFDFVRYSLGSYHYPPAAVFLLGAALAALNGGHNLKAGQILKGMLIVIVGVYVLIVACCAPSVFAQAAYPEERALTGANFVLTAGILAFGGLAGEMGKIIWLKLNAPKANSYQWAGAALLLTLLLYVGYCGFKAGREIPAYRGYAVRWDERAVKIGQMREEGMRDISIFALDRQHGIQEIMEDPQHWVNTCAAGYYEVDSISAR